MAPQKNYYRILQVDSSADPVVIEAAYKKLAVKYHPDINPTPEAGEKMREINEAYAVLSDTVARQRYDREYFGWRPDATDPPESGRSHPQHYPTPLWLKRLWIILGVTGLLLLLRLNPRLALIVGGGWILSALFRLLMRRQKR